MSGLGNKQIFARNLNYYMDKRDVSRNDICEALGVKYSTFTEWANGTAYPRIDKIEMLANYFNIKKSDLIEDKSAVQKEESELEEILESIKERPGVQQLCPRPYSAFPRLVVKIEPSKKALLSCFEGCETLNRKKGSKSSQNIAFL